jgi:hypothetical protein
MSIRFCSVPLLYRRLVNTCYSLFTLCRLCCFRPVSNFRSFSTNISFTGWDCQPHTQTLTWRTKVSLFVWVITFDLSDTWCHHYRQHSSKDHLTTQAPPLRQSRDTFGGVQQLQKCYNCHKYSKQNAAFHKCLQVKPHTWRRQQCKTFV